MDSSSDLYERIRAANASLFSSSSPGIINNPTNSTSSNPYFSSINLPPNPPLPNPVTVAPFDPMLHARLPPSSLDPNSFNSSFHLPTFIRPGAVVPGGYGRNIVEPELSRDATLTAKSNFVTSNVSNPNAISNPFSSTTISSQIQQSQSRQPSVSPFLTIPSLSAVNYMSSPPAQSVLTTAAQKQPIASTSNLSAAAASEIYTPDLSDAVYTPYGSSVVSVNPAPQKPLPTYLSQSASFSQNPQHPTSAFQPEMLGLPVPPPPGTSTNFAGLYSASGFDVLSVLAKVANRFNPVINIGPVDTSCAFLVSDARKWDFPIVFASETFSKLTGYGSEEIIGRNCRFLQSPDGIVQSGAPRKYTDSNASFHMKTHIAAGKESQSSLINYMKGGKPFINLVTVIPISWDTEEIAYYVGFQVDLVDQPTAILDRMKDGTYVVNYSLLNNPPTPKLPVAKQNQLTISQQQQSHQQQHLALNPTGIENWSIAPPPLYAIAPASTIQPAQTQSINNLHNLDPKNLLSNRIEIELTDEERHKRDIGIVDKVVEIALSGKVGHVNAGLVEEEKRGWCRVLLDNADDFIHVISLKGAFLYASPSAARILEYEPAELLTLSLPTLLHPADSIPVMRELKEAGSTTSTQAPAVSLLYRIRRKKSGWIWLESKGRLYVEPGKGRKCIILTARPQEVYKMSWTDLRTAGGLGEAEFWCKLSEEGMVLSCTRKVQAVLGFLMEEMVGTSIFQLIKTDQATTIRNALIECSNGKPVSVRYMIKSRRGYVDVVTRFYPRATTDPSNGNDTEMTDASGNSTGASTHYSIIAQTNEYSSEQRKLASTTGRSAPAFAGVLTSPLTSTAPLTTLELADPYLYDTSAMTTTNSTAAKSTFKSLAHPSATSDNVFDELDVTRCTSWQFELHQIVNINKRLREEKEALGLRLATAKAANQAAALSKKRNSMTAFAPVENHISSSTLTMSSTTAATATAKGHNAIASGSGSHLNHHSNHPPAVMSSIAPGKVLSSTSATTTTTGRRGGSVSKNPGTSEGGNSNKSSKREGGCANCGRMDSPEWRAGPTGVKSLCNACGLRWAKSQRSSSAGSSALSSIAPVAPEVVSRAKAKFAATGSEDGASAYSMEDVASPVTWR